MASPVIVANYNEPKIASQIKVPFSVCKTSVCFDVLVAEDILQECLLGTDFLEKLAMSRLSEAGRLGRLWPPQFLRIYFILLLLLLFIFFKQYLLIN